MIQKYIAILFLTLLLNSPHAHTTEHACTEVDPTVLGLWRAEYVGFDGEVDLYLFINPDRASSVKTVLGAVLRVGRDKGVLVAYGYKSGNDEPCLFKNTGSSFSRIILEEGETRKPFQ